MALRALSAIPANQQSLVVAGYLTLQDRWLFRAISFFQNAALWVLIAVTAYLLFWWRNSEMAVKDTA